MKKLLLFTILCLLLTANFSFADDRTDKPYNIGYAKRYGMVGIYGHLTDYIGKQWGDLYPGGGGFIYYNILNDFWGNFSIGINADYVGGEFTTSNGIKGRTHMAPLSFNIAYMTSSNVVNAWIGAGFSYNFATFDMTGGTYNGVYYGGSQKQYAQLMGVDAFAGLEYLFTKDGRWGAFFEFRYTYSQVPELNYNIAGVGTSVDTIDTQRFRYTVGFSYHF